MLKLNKISVLMVEDSAPMNLLLKSVLEKLEFKNLHTAFNGEEAFTIFQKERPDIVITDWMMEPVNGLELTKMIRNHPQSVNRIVPIIVLTGYNSMKKVMVARDHGCTEYVVKPFTATDIAKRIAYVINNPRDFIQCKNYFGPDRRRKADLKYKGPFRRASDNDLDDVDMVDENG